MMLRQPHPARPAAAGPIGRYLSRQAAGPHGVVGRLMGRIWVRETAAVNDTVIELLNPVAGERICEIGFGPGRALARIAATGAEVIGVDISAVMVAASSRRNARSIAAARMRLHQGDGACLPVPDASLDAVIGVHTLYFWDDPGLTVRGIARALRPGGRVVLAFRAGEHPLPARFDPEVYHVPTTAEASRWLQAAGFTDIDVQRRPHISPAMVWVIATAT